MHTQTEQTTVTTEEKKSATKKRRGTILWVLLVILLFLLLLTTIVLGARLYALTSQDKYTVDLGLGEMDGSIELFRIEYENASGQITVQGSNGQDVIAPGTTASYDLRLRNQDDTIIDFVMEPTVSFLTEDAIPVEFKVVDEYGNYILGSETTWVTAAEMNDLAHRGSVHPGEVYTYHVSWQWVFETDPSQNANDTYLGNITGDRLPGVSVGIDTHATPNPKPVKSNVHMMHLLGQGFGCCWCCWLVWILLILVLLLLVRIVFLRRKVNKLTDQLKEAEEETEKEPPENHTAQ